VLAWLLTGGRLDPPLGLFLDEVANIVPLQQLPALMSFAGGTGIFVTTWQRGHGGSSLSTTLQDRRTVTPEQVRTLSAERREALVIHATTPVVRARLTRHYEGPDREVFAASVTEARRIAGLDRVPGAEREAEQP
jgi:hypothetical protein